MVRLSDEDRAILGIFSRPEVYTSQIAPSRTRRSLEMRGLIEWMPPQFGTLMWTITDAGRRALAESSK